MAWCGRSCRAIARSTHVARLATRTVARLTRLERRERGRGSRRVRGDLVHVRDRGLHDVVDLRLRRGDEVDLHVGRQARLRGRARLRRTARLEALATEG